MNEVFLSKGAHETREDGMCAMEFGAYLAGLEHTDRPACVSPVLLSFITTFNDLLDDDKRQHLRPYVVRTLGTAGDGQDRARAFLAADWVVRVAAPIALEAIGMQEQAISLRDLAPVVDVDSAARAAARAAAAAAAGHAARDAAGRAAGHVAAGHAARAAGHAAAAADAAARAAGHAADAADAAARAAGHVAAGHAADAAARAAAAAAAGHAADAAGHAADAAAHAAGHAADAAPDAWKIGFGLLERMVDPGGLHNLKTEAEWLSSAGVAG